MIKRKLLGSIRKHLGKKEITVIIGPRQSGKTTLMRMLKNEVEAKGGKTVFLNLDLESDKVYFDSQQELINKLRLELGRSRGYVFIDEIQRKENAGLFLKGIYDLQLPYKFIVSGSGSLELKSNIKESLTGRKRLFELLPVTFEEFVNYRTDYRYESNLLEFAEVERPQLEFLLKEYLVFGGYPRVVTEELEEEKRYLLEEIFKIAEEMGEGVFDPHRGTAVYDDHVPLIQRGIRAVNLIDFDYDYWHTMQDVPANCSISSLDSVGRVLLAWIYRQAEKN